MSIATFALCLSRMSESCCSPAGRAKGRPITLEEFLDGIERYDLGGTCYTNNPFLAQLLQAVGYDAELHGADMSGPNVHTVIRVRIGPAEYHVDVGYGAPFRRPMALERIPHELTHGDHRFLLEHAPDGGLQMTMFSRGERRHGYLAHPPARARSFFDEIVRQFVPARRRIHESASDHPLLRRPDGGVEKPHPDHRD